MLDNGLEHWLTFLQRFLDDKLPGQITERHRNFASLQFKFDRYIDVDVLLSPFWREPDHYYQFLKDTKFSDRMRYSHGAMSHTHTHTHTNYPKNTSIVHLLIQVLCGSFSLASRFLQKAA